MIKVQQVCFSYHSSEYARGSALNDVSVEIRQGESLAVMGANGSGKTTFAHCLNGLLKPVKGSVNVDGFDTSNDKALIEIRRRVGMVFQNPDNQIVSATVERELAFGLENLAIPYEEMHHRVEAALEAFHLSSMRHKSPHHLSGGEKQKCALAAVMAMRPDYFVLDEPTSLLDPASRTHILQYIKELKIVHPRITTIFITQFPEEAENADRLIIFKTGKIIMDDTPERIFRNADQLRECGLEPPISYQLEAMMKDF